MIGLYIILAHFVGDYILQTSWMANEKTKRWIPAIVHGIVYTLPYILVTQNWLALLIIWSTHILIDHFRLAKYVIWFINQLSPKKYRYSWNEAKENSGYSPNIPIWLSSWLMFIVDNTIHLLINTGAIIWT